LIGQERAAHILHSALSVCLPARDPRHSCPHAGCDEAFPTSAAAWAHCEGEDDVVYSNRVCLWEGCGYVGHCRAVYMQLEPVHNGVWPFFCATCGNGHRNEERAQLCCRITAACKCGWSRKGFNGSTSFKAHQKKCSQGAAPLPG